MTPITMQTLLHEGTLMLILNARIELNLLDSSFVLLFFKFCPHFVLLSFQSLAAFSPFFFCCFTRAIAFERFSAIKAVLRHFDTTGLRRRNQS
ncbi:hypothetical protein BJ165DRAFT_115455 [Panaeolus papilionaceus]|nr:hypothetical protein BJ165DRAFT_115455 [Panaeolus papilionaceus]